MGNAEWGQVPDRARWRSLEASGRFVILSTLGRGGMGVVYEALDRELDVRVALKVLPDVEPEAVLRFKNEFRSIADLSHPNLVELGELFEDAGAWFFTMELVRGADFVQHVRARRGPVEALAPEVDPAPDDGNRASGLRPVALAHDQDSEGPVDSGSFSDLARLRASLAQLARGIMALHEAGKVHGDIKPSNVLVTPLGHLKVLDFGLTRDPSRSWVWDPSQLLGTPSYMAPELLVPGSMSAAVDWYAVGVMLYLALAGRLPFIAHPKEVLLLKAASDPPPPSTYGKSVPEDLERLAMELLCRDPAKRANGVTILERLRQGRTWSMAAGERTAFVGREKELATCREAFEATRNRGLTLLVYGESGVGKSALASEFADRITREDPDALVLRTSCYERETVPFKAVDGIVDALSEALLRSDASAAVLPADVDLLAQVFPVLRRVPSIAKRLTGPLHAESPDHLRARMFAAFVALVGQVADKRRMAIVIDDLQWTDTDSLLLLQHLMRSLPSPRVLVVATMRAGGASSETRIDPNQLGAVRALRVSGLPRAEATQLAIDLLCRLGGMDLVRAEAIADEARGHPLLIQELVRYARASGQGGAEALRLDDAIGARIKSLPSLARALLAAVVVSWGPASIAMLGRALDVDQAELRSLITLLRQARLVRATGVRTASRVEPYHDHVRRTARSLLDPPTLREVHARIALALEGLPTSRPEALAWHWREGGRADRAAAHAIVAATSAEGQLAFNRAAEMFAFAMDASSDDAASRVALGTKLGDVLTFAGRGREAAEAYLAAASGHGSGSIEALELERRAALQLLSAGFFEEGSRVMRRVLDQVGIPLPSGPLGPARTVLRRLFGRVRGLGFEPRSAASVPPAALARVDACWAAVVGLGLVDPVGGAELQTRHLQLALDAGEPFRVCRALCGEAMHLAVHGRGAAARTRLVLERITEIVDSLGAPPELRSLSFSIEGATAYLEGRFRDVPEPMARAEELYGRAFTEYTNYERDTVRVLRLGALTWLGRWAEFAARAEPLLEEALERKLLYTSTYARTGIHTQVWLARGHVDLARERAAAALRGWPAEAHVPHLLHAVAEATLALWSERPAEALGVLDAAWRRAERSQLLRCQYLRLNLLDLRVRALVACAAAEPSLPSRARWLGQVNAAAARLADEGLEFTAPLAQLARAGAAAVEGRLERAAELLVAALGGFEASDMRMHVAVTARRLAAIRGGDLERALLARSEAILQGEQVCEGDRVARLLAPGF